MTSDAKVGLLLGLVFIVIIAFLINGLPSLMADGGGEDAFDTLVEGSNKNLALGSRADEAVQAIQDSLFPPQEPRQVDLVSIRESDKRFGDGDDGQDEILEHFEVVKRKRPPRPKERIYTVRDGDNLGAIAKAVYGAEEGNRRVIVQNLFEANKGILKSPDDLFVGQKLKVPSLSATINVTGVSLNNPDESMFEKLGDAIKNVFNKPKPPEYVVKDGDSLWAIATKVLGDGNRYHEIKSLNKEIYDEEELYVGMRLRLPKR